jgi:hypothetical protein
MFPVTQVMQLTGGGHGQNRLLWSPNPCFFPRLCGASPHTSRPSVRHLTLQASSSSAAAAAPSLPRELKSSALKAAVAHLGGAKFARAQAQAGIEHHTPYPSSASSDCEKLRVQNGGTDHAMQVGIQICKSFLVISFFGVFLAFSIGSPTAYFHG